jgi:hypothetical protein
MFNLFKSIPADAWFAIGASVISFLMGIIFTIIRWTKTKTSKYSLFCNKKSGKDFTNIHSQINEILTEVRVELGSARTFISQFHNGGDFFSGENILKFSITHESCLLGIEQTIDKQQGVLLTSFTDKLKLLQEPQPRVVFVNDLPDSHFKGFMEARNSIAFIMIPLIKTGMISPFGYICCEWCSWKHAEQINFDKLNESLNKNVRIIKTLLTTK